MEAVILEPGQKSDWDEFVATSREVIAWHSYDWSKVLVQYYNAGFYPIAVYEGAKIAGILPLYHIRTLRSGDALMSIPHVVAGGIAAKDENVQQLLLQKAIELSKKHNDAKITLKQYKHKIRGPLVTDENYYNRELSLSEDAKETFSAITEENRAKVEESRKHDFLLEYPSQDISEFYRLLLVDQHAAGVPCVSRRWVDALVRTQMYGIAMVRLNGEPVSGTMVKIFRDTVSFPFSCIRDQSQRSLLAAYSLYWQLMERLSASGIRLMHSGRIPKTDAVPAYRLGWGGTKCSYYYQYYGISGAHTEFSTKRGGKRDLIETVWKHMPLSLAEMIGPTVVKQFP